LVAVLVAVFVAAGVGVPVLVAVFVDVLAGVALGLVVEAATGFRASMIPDPELTSMPGSSLSSAVDIRICLIAAGVRLALRESITAAIAAACGAAADVPKTGAKPGVAVVTPSAAVMS